MVLHCTLLYCTALHCTEIQVPGIPESAYNIDIILKAVGVRSHPFTISSDFKFLMPCFAMLLHPPLPLLCPLAEEGGL